MHSQLQACLSFCDHYQFSPFPVSKHIFLAYLVFLSHSLASYQSLLNYTNILKHINNALGANVFHVQLRLFSHRARTEARDG